MDVSVCWKTLEWFRNHEYVAIWLEGIALVAIFVWDRLDSRSEHRETLAQLEVSRANASTGKASADALMNAERAWVLAELGWYEGARLGITDHTSGERTWTEANLKLTCKNEGRSPAWIDEVYTCVEMFSNATVLRKPEVGLCQTSGPLGPIGPGKEVSHCLQLACGGRRKIIWLCPL
jgi:hypothetical protein